jgi:hypothetical protein
VKTLPFKFFIILLMSHSAFARAEATCTSIVTTAQEAADRADMVIEATITLFLSPSDRSRPMEVVTEKSRALFNPDASSFYGTMSLPVDSCFPDQQHRLSKEAMNRMTGKPMRLYVTTLTNSRGYRLFFMQPAGEPAPAFRTTKQSFATKGYPDSSGIPLADGWRQARSTDGNFSIAMPGKFLDATMGGPGEPGFMLRGTDQDGSTYLAVFERAGSKSAMSGTFDDMYEKADAVKSTFKGASAVNTVGTVAGPGSDRKSYGLWFRVPGGTFMLGVVASKGSEAQAMKNTGRFFNSLEFK